MLAWTLGSFAGVRTADAVLIGIIAIASAGALTACARVLDAFAFGDLAAGALGISVHRARWALLTGCAFVTAVAVATVGPIGFVGLVVPHLVRLVSGPSHHALLPLSALVGALLMLWSDTGARTLGQGSELPVGVITAAVGTPVLIALLRRQARRA